MRAGEEHAPAGNDNPGAEGGKPPQGRKETQNDNVKSL